MNFKKLKLLPLAFLVLFVCGIGDQAWALQQRNMVSYLRGPYNIAFFYRHNPAFRIASAIHFSHGIQHDILQLTPIEQHKATDIATDADYLSCVYSPPRTEPPMELFGPYVARIAFGLYRAIDWTHMHHEQTYDILSEKSIPWNQKKEWTDRAVQYYLEKHDIPRSPAPLDVTMRRAAVMMKPYATLFRNYYPQSNNFFYAAHWWHPVIYEAMMIGGNDPEQEKMVQETNAAYFSQVLQDRPKRMLLSREAMPRYSRLSPESANIFDNLHMLHGIAYDILAYEKWTPEQKKDELDRVIQAMSYQPGDERYVRKFNIPRPDMDPRVYGEWLKGVDGEMNRIMEEMMQEMMPLMSSGEMDPQMHKKMMNQFRMKLEPGMQEGEHPGSIMDAMKKVMPDMKMKPESMEPGATPKEMVNAMLRGWEEKYGNLPDIEPISMETDPSAPPLPEKARQLGWKPMQIQNIMK
jgi:hypothetical protein